MLCGIWVSDRWELPHLYERFFFLVSSEEVCRVMENLSRSIFAKLFSVGTDSACLEDGNTATSTNNYSQRSRHDPRQRPGKMRARHNAANCEACQYGLCF